MEPHVLLRELWQPILLSTVLCFFAGFVLHVLLPLHKGDFTALPGEGGVLDALKKAGAGAGQYMLPWCDPKDMKSPEFQAKWAAGPVGILVLRKPGKLTMTPMLAWMVVYHLVVSVFVASHPPMYIVSVSSTYSSLVTMPNSAGIFVALIVR